MRSIAERLEDRLFFTAAPLNINAGGPAIGNFVADTDFTGGKTYSTTAPIDTSAVTNPAPQQVYQTERFGNFTYTDSGLTAGSAYSVRLDFDEIYWSSANQRLFNVTINGTQVLSNFDIYATAGGMNKAIAQTFTATADSSGQIVIGFVTVSDNAKVDGIEITPISAPASLQINAGGPAVGSFAADEDFSGGSTYSTTAAIDTSAVTDPAPQPVYQTERFGNFTYTDSGLAPGSTYNVQLDFDEIYWNAPNQRLFNVTINGTQVLSNFDIFATAGAQNKAITETFAASANSSGQIVIGFSSVMDNAKVDGIEITMVAPPPAGTVQINSGGPAVALFAADGNFSGGSTFSTTAPVDTSGVANPAPQQVYQSERFGNFTYTDIGLTPDSVYSVRLDFDEIYFDAANQRLFNVTLNGMQVLSNFDIFAAAGGMDKAISETFTVAADDDGQIVISFTSVKDNAKVDGIEIGVPSVSEFINGNEVPPSGDLAATFPLNTAANTTNFNMPTIPPGIYSFSIENSGTLPLELTNPIIFSDDPGAIPDPTKTGNKSLLDSALYLVPKEADKIVGPDFDGSNHGFNTNNGLGTTEYIYNSSKLVVIVNAALDAQSQYIFTYTFQKPDGTDYVLNPGESLNFDIISQKTGTSYGAGSLTKRGAPKLNIHGHVV